METWSRRVRSVLPAVATFALAALAGVLGALAAVHALADDRHLVLALIHGTIGWTLLPAAPLAFLSFAAGRRRVAALCVAVAALHVAWVAPGHGPRPARASGARIATANLFVVNPKPERRVAALHRLDADVACLQELSSVAADLLARGEAAQRWPHRWLQPADSAFGIGIVSRLPLVDAWGEDLRGVPLALATLGGEGPVAGATLVCVHTTAPRTTARTARWAAELDALTARVAAIDGPVIVAGDLNATRHHPAYRRLLAGAGLTDAHADVGRASAWTWPAPPYWRFLPKLRLDHVLLSNDLRALRAVEADAVGSDHRPVVVTVGRRSGR